MDVVCADKTGTLTESGMRVCEVEELDGAGRQESVADVLAALAAADARPNASMQAIAEAFTRRRAGSWPRTRLSSRPPSGAASPFAITVTG